MRKHFLLYINNSTTNKMSKSFLTVVHIVIHNGGNIHRSLKCCIQNFKTSLKKMKISETEVSNISVNIKVNDSRYQFTVSHTNTSILTFSFQNFIYIYRHCFLQKIMFLKKRSWPRFGQP